MPMRRMLLVFSVSVGLFSCCWGSPQAGKGGGFSSGGGGRSRAGGLTHHALLLRLYDDLPYNEELHKVVNDTTKKLQMTANGQVVEEYWRINDVTSSYKAKVAVVKDANQKSKAAKDEIERVEVEYWDYWREVKDQAGQTSTQFLFVEMDTDNGWFQLWQGQEIDPQRVFVL
jgi:hypothetical protein